jgi:CRP-like cAMP-binding protein
MQASQASLDAIHSHHLFAGLEPDQFQRVLETARVETLENGQLLFSRSQPARHFYLVLEGQINLVVSSRSGEEKIVDILGPGNSFAEAVMFMEATVYPLSAVAAGPSTVARFVNQDYLAQLRGSPDTCLRMLADLSRRLHMRIRDIEYLTLESALHRLVRLIESRLPPPCEGPCEITLTESRQELASRLSMKPETLSRLLRQLSDCGAIVVQGRLLQVPDRNVLGEILNSQR